MTSTMHSWTSAGNIPATQELKPCTQKAAAMGDGEGVEMKPTLVVVSLDKHWSALTSLLQETLGGEGNGVSLSSAGPYRVCDVTVDRRCLSLLSVPLTPNMSRDDVGQALDGCFRSNSRGAVVFLLLIQGGRYTKEKELVEVLQQRFGAEVFKFLVVLSLERDTVVVVDVLDDSLLDLIQLCDGRFCRATGPPATRGELAALHKTVEQVLEENGAGGYSQEMLDEARRRDTEDTAMGFLLEKLLRADEQAEAFEETRARELEELERRQAEERRSEAEEKGRYRAKKESLEEAVRSYASMVHPPQMNCAPPDDETRKTSIVLVGLSGSGKTSTMNLIQQRAGRQYSLQDPGLPVPQPTTSCRRKEVVHRGETLLLVDTPELLDEDGAEDLDAVKDCLALALPGPHVFFLVLQVGRFTQGEVELFGQLPRIFGAQFAERCVVVFTRGDDKTARSVDRYVARAPAALQEIVRRCGSRYYALNVMGSRQTGLSHPQVKELLSGVSNVVASHAGEPLATRRFSVEELRDRMGRMEEAGL
ncbi:GTPase IMAP family member 7 [Merluccius polli]|uniref:GTPase IMAP family member 7 n=1 Tax=Merluccius polli TaxID=89951 RepID=A0AA47NCJ3_MERPO|nr:GTPase IMAP family member 7 [Merluccius polli]